MTDDLDDIRRTASSITEDGDPTSPLWDTEMVVALLAEVGRLRCRCCMETGACGDADELRAEVARLKGEVGQLAGALRDAAQQEWSRFATAQARREQADGWLDMARRHLPAPSVQTGRHGRQ